MDKLIVEYVLTAIEVIMVCLLIVCLIAVYSTCNLAATAYENDVGVRQQQELYAVYAKYDEKVITDTEVLSLLAKGANTPDGIKLYASQSASNAFKNLKCNETVNIGSSSVLAGLRENIPAGSRWYAKIKTFTGNNEISYLEIKKMDD